jgi:hypothetical protein
MKIANSGAIWRYEKCVENVHPIKLRCKTPETTIFKDQNFYGSWKKGRLNSSSPHPKILPVNRPFFQAQQFSLLIPYALLFKQLPFPAAVTRPCSFLMA